MSHVTGSLVWHEGVYAKSHLEADRLVLTLDDGTCRYMNFENWGKTTLITQEKLRALKPGAAIRIATWNGYNPREWFCDVEEVKDPVPLIATQLSPAWIVKHANSGRKFEKNVVRCVDCCIFKRKVYQRSCSPEGYATRSGFAINFFPLDPFFHDYRVELRAYSEDFSLLDKQAPIFPLYRITNTEPSQKVSSKWHELELLDFIHWIEQHIEEL